MTDTLTKFLFEHATVRGELVELRSSWQHMLEHQQYPLPVQNLLGELTSAAALLCANLKFEGSMIMQIHSDGPVKLLVVECDNHLQIRAMAKLADQAVIEADANLQSLLNPNGRGRFIITLDPSDKSAGQRPYQGIVPIEGTTIAEIIETYMRQSDQLETRLWLACDAQVSRGMLLQRLPDHGGTAVRGPDIEPAQSTWERACMLGNTLKSAELIATDIATLMHRLFWEESLQVFEAQPIRFICTCSRAKVSDMLVMLGQTEINEALNSLGKLEINCDFCGQPYQFDSVDCAQLFLPPENTVLPDLNLSH